MGVTPNLFSSGDTDYDNGTDTTPNPNKYNYTIPLRIQGSKYDVLLVHYPHCTTFDGLKLLLVKPGFGENQTELDPHFFENGAVEMRAKPTLENLNKFVIMAATVFSGNYIDDMNIREDTLTRLAKFN